MPVDGTLLPQPSAARDFQLRPVGGVDLRPERVLLRSPDHNHHNYDHIGATGDTLHHTAGERNMPGMRVAY